MSNQDSDRAVDEVDVAATWEGLTSGPRSQLVDVRTRAEWTYVGIPDLGPIGKRAVLVEWQTFPDQSVDARFVERLAGELKALGVQLDDDLYFICRSGSRSLAAAKAMAEAGYRVLSQRLMRFRRAARRFAASRLLQWMESVRSSLAARLVGKT